MRAFWERRMEYLETDLDIRFLTMRSPYQPAGRRDREVPSASR
jgi:hypothetical protein